MKILLATDGSEHSEEAARFLTGLKLTPNDEIFILHAVSWVPLISEWETLYVDFRKIM
jgi:nucleotide-binding universal stress UspA family protein